MPSGSLMRPMTLPLLVAARAWVPRTWPVARWGGALRVAAGAVGGGGVGGWGGWQLRGVAWERGGEEVCESRCGSRQGKGGGRRRDGVFFMEGWLPGGWGVAVQCSRAGDDVGGGRAVAVQDDP